jgi:hypothetical protein
MSLTFSKVVGRGYIFSQREEGTMDPFKKGLLLSGPCRT